MNISFQSLHQLHLKKGEKLNGCRADILTYVSYQETYRGINYCSVSLSGVPAIMNAGSLSLLLEPSHSHYN